MFVCLTYLLLAALLLQCVCGYIMYDRVASTYQVLHNEWKSPITDFPLVQMPRFGEKDTFIFHTVLPSRDMHTLAKPNATSDVKIQLTFDNSLMIPWVKIYDSRKKHTLKKLTLTFSKDKYSILRVAHENEYDPEGQNIDLNHPTSTTFDIVYQWQGSQEQDNPHGIFVMFLTVSIIGILMIIIVSRSRSNSHNDRIKINSFKKGGKRN